MAEPPKSEFQQIIATEGQEGWKTLWQKGITSWNIGKTAPPLVELVEYYQLLQDKSNLRTLVPGCGQGYDVSYLAQQPQVTQSIGLELSPLAVEQAKQLTAPLPDGIQQKIQYLEDDFFTFSPVESFDLVVDYTFLCAINPSLREQWSQQMSRLVRPKTGLLVTLMFPLTDHKDGPPFSLSEAEYHRLLDGSFDLIKSPYKSPVTIETRRDRELIAVWRRKA